MVIWLVFGIGINEMKWKKYIFFVIFAAMLFHGAKAYVYVYNDNRAVHASTADFLKNIEIAAVTVNPFAPSGYSFEHEVLRDTMQEALPDIPVIDVRL